MTDTEQPVVQAQGSFDEYTLAGPFVELTFEGRPSNWFVAAFYITMVALLLAAIYAYAVILPSLVGFETAVLIGIGLIVLGGTQ